VHPNRVAGGLSPPAPTAPRMRVRTGRFLRMGKEHPLDESLQRCLQHDPPRPFHPVGCVTAVEARPSRSLPKIRAFTVSHPLRWAFGYYAVC
jgi:hypothetical protein